VRDGDAHVRSVASARIMQALGSGTRTIGKATMLERLRNGYHAIAKYELFERVALRAVQVLLGLMTVYAIVLVVIGVATDVTLGTGFMEKAVLQDTFGSILTILILLEFNHSVQVAVSHRSGALQVRIIVLITVLVIARKLMLLDYATVSIETMLGYSALLLALGALYWLIVASDHRRIPPGSTPGP
jgi:uncharacterized membrane protein (DUF373 family)